MRRPLRGSGRAVSLRESDGDFRRDFGRTVAQDGAQTRWEITGRQGIGGRFQLGEAPPTPGGKVRLLGLGLTARVGLEVRDISQEPPLTLVIADASPLKHVPAMPDLGLELEIT